MTDLKVIDMTNHDTVDVDINKVLPGSDGSPFRMLVAGTSGTGKTNMLLNLIARFMRSKQTGKLVFDEYFIFSPTIFIDKAWKTLMEFPDLMTNTMLFDELDIEFIEKNIINSDDPAKKLIIMDDFAGSEDMHDSIIKQLFFRSRHSNTSVIITTQSYKEIAKAIRINNTHMIIYPPNNTHEDKLIEEEIGTRKLNGKMLINVFNALPKYSFLYKVVPAQEFYINFDKRIV